MAIRSWIRNTKQSKPTVHNVITEHAFALIGAAHELSRASHVERSIPCPMQRLEWSHRLQPLAPWTCLNAPIPLSQTGFCA
ncbi:hypothetical protein V6N12_033365 [Hibiscus sabdariffa]